jgi:hypothetical protein
VRTERKIENKNSDNERKIKERTGNECEDRKENRKQELR